MVIQAAPGIWRRWWQTSDLDVKLRIIVEGRTSRYFKRATRSHKSRMHSTYCKGINEKKKRTLNSCHDVSEREGAGEGRIESENRRER